ncbi:L-xylulose reductase-like [Oopsacas minuta]|uniref:L-xylulose reductase-like n=1 Tax=Oopsacas minuta TaxID=111878 RepID=A0AAV7K1T9_9METZ|nr:L-xylulose reductase-like [Oopsacas minuta]
MDIRFDGKRVLVTGAGKGIGRGTAIMLMQCGAEVIALSRTQSDLDSLAEEHPSIKIIVMDLADIAAVKTEIPKLSPIHLLVNNAAIGEIQPFLEVTEDSFDRVVNVNFKSCLFVAQAVARDMVERGKGGAIVNVSSQASQVALQDHTVYSGTKAALDSMTRTMALELGPKQIRVNAVNPTVVLTKMGKVGWSDPAKAGPMMSKIPQGKFAEVKDVVHAILYLLSDKADMINGSTLAIDGGFLAC